MYEVFGSNRSRVKAITEAIMFGLAVVALLFIVAAFYSEGRPGLALFMYVTAVFVTLIALDGVRQGYKAYPVVVTDYHMVVADPFGKRRVFDLDKITKFRIIKRRLLMIHNGWPTVVYVHGLLPERQRELERMLRAGGRVGASSNVV